MKTVFYAFITIFILSCVIYNLRKEIESLNYELVNPYLNKMAGKRFSSSHGYSRNMLLFAEKNIPKNSSVFYWTMPMLQQEISTECRAYELNYFLYPSKIGYGKDADLSQYEFVLSQTSIAHMAEYRLKALKCDYLIKAKDEYHTLFALKQKR